MKNKLDLKSIKQSAIVLSRISEKQKNLFLRYLSKILLQKRTKIITANERDLIKAKAGKLPSALIERLVLGESEITQLISKLRDIEKLQSGIGEIVEEKTGQQGLSLKKVRVPLGVIIVIYEARPEVTIDVAALCIKSGNVAILKSGSEALHTNKAIYDCILLALDKTGLSKETISFISSSDRRITNYLLKQHDFIDLVIARGGYGLVKTVLSKSTIPVLAHAAGGARIYIDKSADLVLAQKVIVNAKTSKPAACNSLDTIVVHRDIADQFVDQITKALQEQNVKVIDEKKATKKDWDTEFLGLTTAIKVVKDVEEAIIFINKHSKRHSEGIITDDKSIIAKFTQAIDAASIFVNCSTRLHDGEVYGLGAEMGISTSKLHARGPVGLMELTSFKWIIEGKGQVRS